MNQLDELRQMFNETVADLVRAERAIVLLRQLVDECDQWPVSVVARPTYSAAKRYLAELDASDRERELAKAVDRTIATAAPGMYVYDSAAPADSPQR